MNDAVNGAVTDAVNGAVTDEDRIATAVRRAVDDGDLPGSALVDRAEPVSWPVMVLLAIGGLVSAVMMTIGFALVFWAGGHPEASEYAVGVLTTVACIALLRKRRLALYPQFVALPLLVAGVVSLAAAVFTTVDRVGRSDLSPALPEAAALGVLLLAAVAIERTWVRWLLAAGAGGTSVLLLMELATPHGGSSPDRIAGDRLAVQLAVLLGGAALAGHHLCVRSTAPVWLSSALDAIGAGWLVGAATVTCFTDDVRYWWSDERLPASGLALALAATSVLLVLAAAVTAWVTWPPLRGPALVTAAAAVGTVTWFIPATGPLAAAATFAVLTRRFALGGALGIGALAAVSLSYWDFHQSLGAKGLILVGSGAVLGVGALLPGPSRARPVAAPAPEVEAEAEAEAAEVTTEAAEDGGGPGSWVRHRGPGTRRRALLAAVTVIGVLAVSGLDLYRSEQVVAGSGVYYLRLAQFDPRAPLQGDYVALRYQLPETIADRLRTWTAGSAPVVAARGVAGGELDVVDLLDPGASVPAGSVRIRCVNGAQGWQPGPDSWFVKEGTGQRYQDAVLAQVRIDPDGTVHLLGLADHNRAPLPAP